MSATPESLAPLRVLARKCKEAIERRDLAAVHEYDSQLHLEIAERTGNTELIRILRTLDAKLQLLRLKQQALRLKQHVPIETLSFYLDQHEILIQLIENKEIAKIDELLEKHIVHDLDARSEGSGVQIGLHLE